MRFFDFAFQYLIGDEGTEYTNDPDDSGGPTHYGITQKDYEAFLGHKITPEQVKQMTIDVAKRIYEILYWEPNHLDMVDNQNVATAVFDTIVLYGAETGTIMAQKALNEFGQKLDVDGKNGPKTQASLTAAQPKQFIPALKDQILQRIEHIIEEAPKDKKFRDGWTNRANRLLTLVPKTKGGLT